MTGKKEKKNKDKNDLIQLSISTNTHKFLKQYCPHSMNTSLIHSEHKPKSKYITLMFDASKIDCVLKVIGDTNLVENVNATIEKDLRKILAKI